MAAEKIFKECPMCETCWKTRDDFISEKSLVLNGYQADFARLDHGLFYFTHNVNGCFSTMVLEAKEFLSLYHGPIYPERKTGKKECPGYCIDEKQLSRCSAECECAYIREIIQIIEEKKQG